MFAFDYRDAACRMTGKDWNELPSALRARLDRMYDLIKAGGGIFRSSQVVASVIVQYEADVAKKLVTDKK